ncbi:uncharacterized protein LOC110269102 isoform X1 [Arachis ipaensis]|uniref:uncharacterized protein LOC110269102 isoform X1 n=1 Tax=Arachis ipaensis TaxID=130454 RepID=UPI000A2AF98C|nr:uncharacterized protein LOC110269102 isoform X1 [Arachis ipaensis]XP_029145836.1 uncharacterized protein LOC114924712 isoform X1 [Arachis hypogaea]
MIKQMILKRIGKIWKDTRGKLFHQFYDGTKTLEQNIAQCPEGIDPSNWKWSLEYRMRADTQERLQGRRISRGEIWNKVHKRKDVSYIHNNVQTTRETIMNIACLDDSSRELPQNDPIIQALKKKNTQVKFMVWVSSHVLLNALLVKLHNS